MTTKPPPLTRGQSGKTLSSGPESTGGRVSGVSNVAREFAGTVAGTRGRGTSLARDVASLLVPLARAQAYSALIPRPGGGLSTAPDFRGSGGGVRIDQILLACCQFSVRRDRVEAQRLCQ